MVQIVIAVVFMFFLLVSLHEWGHFYFARRAGILVREFAIGFGPKLFSVKKGETRYTLRLLPIGGFVRMAGEDPETLEIQQGQTIAVRMKDNLVTRIYTDRLEERSDVLRGEVRSIDLEDDLHIRLDTDGDLQHLKVHPQAMLIGRGQEIQIAPRDRQFASKPVGKRAMAIFAGPFMNFVLAFVLFGITIQLTGVAAEESGKVIINGVVENSPAESAGLRKGDWIKSINGQAVGGDIESFIGMIEKSAGQPMKWVVVRRGEEVSLTVTPGQDGKVGIYPGPEMRRAGVGESLVFAGESMARWTGIIFEGFQKLIAGEIPLKEINGPVKTTEVTVQIAKTGFPNLVHWAAVLSLYLGIFNLLPIPALDGSRLIFLGLEAVRGKPVDPNRESMVHFIGFAMLMLLMVVVTYNDIVGLVRK
jgi:regulator of sigma E protease